MVGGDKGQPKQRSRFDISYPPYAYKPDCSFEILLQTWTKEELTGIALTGGAEMSIPTVSKTKTWKCHFRTAEVAGEEAKAMKSVNGLHYINTFLYCPWGKGISGGANITDGLCPTMNRAVSKEGASIKAVFELRYLPASVLIARSDNNKNTIQIGPVELSQISKRTKTGMSMKYVTDALTKPPVTLVGDSAPVVALDTGASDKCADDWSPREIVGRCFGLITHSDYREFKKISVVQSAQQCKAMCCELGYKCITWQYWTDIKLCKMGGSVRIGSEGANTPLWCDIEPPIVWEGQKLDRLPSGEMKPGAKPEAVSTQCFGLGADQKKKVTDGSGKVQSVSLSVSECREACLAKKDCRVWQAHERRGCYYNEDISVFCEPYKGSYTGGRRKCNDQCPKPE